MPRRFDSPWAYLDLPRSARVPIWREYRVLAEARAASRLGPPEPADPGRDVLLVHGFLDDGRGVGALAERLEAAGHRVRRADIGRNVACAEEMAGRLARAVRDAVADVGAPVVLVGHSRGGTLARAVTVRHPELVAALVTVGSPLVDPHATTIVLKLVKLGMSALSHLGVDGLIRDCGFGDCCDAFFRDVTGPFPDQVPFVSVFSRSDGMVAAPACRDPAAQLVELDTTHTGLVMAPAGLAAIERALHQLPLAARDTG